MNSDILNRHSLTENEEHDSLTNFEDHFRIACLSYFLDNNMCGFLYIWGSSDPKL